ncbi:MAG: hypothetical protein ACPGJI_09810, partial [Kangiellaceae bacterium]
MDNIKNLEIGWVIAKEKEDEAKTERLRIEKEIVNICKGEKSFGNIKITYGESRKWDDEAIKNVENNIDQEFFPFKRTYKEVRAETKVLEKMHKDFWKEHFAPHLTIKP